MYPLFRSTSLVFFPLLLSVVASAHEFDELSNSEILELLKGPSREQHLSNLKRALQEDTEGSLTRRLLDDSKLKKWAYLHFSHLEVQWADLILAYQVEDSKVWEIRAGVYRSPADSIALRISRRFSMEGNKSWNEQLMFALDSTPGRASLANLLKRLAEIPIEERTDDISAYHHLKIDLLIETERHGNYDQTDRARAERQAQRGSNRTRPRSKAGPGKRAKQKFAETGSNPENRSPLSPSWVVGVSVVLLFSSALIYWYSKEGRQV